MAASVVNIDALIPREDFAVNAGKNSARTEKISIRDLENGFFLSALRKPDFQRETASWSPEKVVDLVRTFLEGDLIPAVILWQSGEWVFVIDGAHRLSALIASVHNDYGDGARSKNFFGNSIPPDQKKVADRTRKSLHQEIGSYADHQAACNNPGNATQSVVDRAKRLATNAIVVQWVPANDAKAAEDSFFKINQQAAALDPTESKIIKARSSPNALAARAIVRAGTGHKYWSAFPDDKQRKIEEVGKKLYEALYEPSSGEGPAKTLDLPVAGRGYNALPFVFDLVNLADDQKKAPLTICWVRTATKMEPKLWHFFMRSTKS